MASGLQIFQYLYFKNSKLSNLVTKDIRGPCLIKQKGKKWQIVFSIALIFSSLSYNFTVLAEEPLLKTPLFLLPDTFKDQMPEETSQAEICSLERELFSEVSEAEGPIENLVEQLNKDASPDDDEIDPVFETKMESLKVNFDRQIELLSFYRTRTHFVTKMNLGHTMGIQACLSQMYSIDPNTFSESQKDESFFLLTEKNLMEEGWLETELECDWVVQKILKDEIQHYYSPMKMNLALSNPRLRDDNFQISEAPISVEITQSSKLHSEPMFPFDNNPAGLFLRHKGLSFYDPLPVTEAETNIALTEYHVGQSNRCWCVDLMKSGDLDYTLKKNAISFIGDEHNNLKTQFGKWSQWLKSKNNFCDAMESIQKGQRDWSYWLNRAGISEALSEREEKKLKVFHFGQIEEFYRSHYFFKRERWRMERYQDVLSILERAPLLLYSKSPNLEPIDLYLALGKTAHNNKKTIDHLVDKDNSKQIEQRLTLWSSESLSEDQKEELRDDLLFYLNFNEHFKRLGLENSFIEKFGEDFEYLDLLLNYELGMKNLKQAGIHVGAIIGAVALCNFGPSKLKKLWKLKRAWKLSHSARRFFVTALRRLSPLCLAGIGLPLNTYILGSVTHQYLMDVHQIMSSPDGDYMLKNFNGLSGSSSMVVAASLFMPININRAGLKLLSGDLRSVFKGQSAMSRYFKGVK